MAPYARIEAWSSVATAVFTGIGQVIAIGALVVAYISYGSAEKQAELKTTADAISEWAKASPPNVSHCFAFLSALGPRDLGVIVARNELTYATSSEDSLLACISD